MMNLTRPTKSRAVAFLLFAIASSQLLAQTSPSHRPDEVVREFIDPSRHGAGDVEAPLPLLPPGNDACASATVLTVNAPCVTGSTSTATTQVGEFLCINPGGGITPETIWYRFTATQANMVLGAVITNATNCATVLAVYGPFAPGGGCLPAVGNQILCQNMGLIDPGFHPLLTGLTVGQDYLVQVQGNNCGGGNDRFANVCMSINTLAPNTVSATASVINNCGTAFTGTTSGGHFASGTSTGNNNLDNNAATSITGASEVGDDVTFIINNASWFSFCNGNASTCSWSVLVNGIGSCRLSAPNAGVQAAVFTGTPSALTNVAISPSNIPPGGSFTSGNFNVGAGQCAYIVVDGFAGDECNYNLTLSNVSCPCVVVPIELAFFTGRNMLEQIHLEWEMAAADGLHSFSIARGATPESMEMIATDVPKDPDPRHRYLWADRSPLPGWNYYRISATDVEGNVSQLNTIGVYRQQGAGLELLAASANAEALVLDVNSPLAAAMDITVVDVQGRTVLHTTRAMSVGSNHLELDAASLAGGMYTVRVAIGQEVSYRKLGRVHQ